MQVQPSRAQFFQQRLFDEIRQADLVEINQRAEEGQDHERAGPPPLEREQGEQRHRPSEGERQGSRDQ